MAAAFWGQTPSCGTPSIAAAGLTVPTVGLADLGDCSILVDPARFTFSGAACTVVVHEYGHLIGKVHSSDPNDVMYPVLRKAVEPCVW